MKTVFLVLLFTLSNQTISQRLDIQQCGAYFLSYVEKKAPYIKDSYHDIGFLQLSYTQKINKSFSFGVGVSFYAPYVSFNIDDYPYSNFISEGDASGDFFNLTFLALYKYPLFRRLHVNSYFCINNSYYRVYPPLGIDNSIEGGIPGQTTIKGKVEYKGYEGFQFRPEVSIGIEWLFLKYFSLEANVAYIQGTKRIQELEIRYTLMDSEEYYAKNYSNGSMWVPSIGLSFYFGGYPKKKAKIKEKKRIVPKNNRRKIYK